MYHKELASKPLLQCGSAGTEPCMKGMASPENIEKIVSDK
jgi:hypothetical protein